MAKVLVVYVSTTGNTEKMANAIADGAKGAGADVSLKTVSEASVSELGNYDVIAFGSPAMGAEVLEEAEMEPFFSEAKKSLYSVLMIGEMANGSEFGNKELKTEELFSLTA